MEERELGKKGGRICKMKVEVEEEFRKEALPVCRDGGIGEKVKEKEGEEVCLS